MTRFLSTSMMALALMAGTPALAASHCNCDEKCTADCQKGKSENCQCKDCGCAKGHDCKHGKCGKKKEKAE